MILLWVLLSCNVFPPVTIFFLFYLCILQQLSAEGLAYNTEPLQWALLQFQHSVYCPIGSLIIGSRLDTDTSDHPSSGINNNHNSSGGGSAGAGGKDKEGGK